jgi:hypothetical protein
MRTWVLFGGVLLAIYGVFRLGSGLLEGAEASANNPVVSGIIAGVGVVLVIVSFFLKEDDKNLS